MSLVIIVMGVSGAGKSTVAQALAQALNLRYFDADNFHSDVNKAKMASGLALTDTDREPWLNSLASAISQWQKEEQGAVLACSALKDSYRKRLNAGHAPITTPEHAHQDNTHEHPQEHPRSSGASKLVYLKASYEEIYRRMEQRQNHFMKADMLKSQFNTLEEPTDAIVVDATGSLEEIVAQVLEELRS
jgi:gluconokinase